MATSQDNNSTDPTDINEVLNSLGQMVNELDACAKDVDKVKSIGIYQDADLSLEALLADTDEFDNDDQLCLIRRGSQVQSFQPSTGNCTSQQNVCLKSVEDNGMSGYHTASMTLSQKGRCTPLQKAPNKSKGVYTGQLGYKDAAINKVDFNTEVRGSFKNIVNESAGNAESCTKMHTPSSPLKSQSNHVSPLEMCHQSSSSKTAHFAGFEKHEFAEGHNLPQNTCTHQWKKKELATITQIPVKVYSDNHEPVLLMVMASMTAMEACHKLVLLNEFEDDPQWVLVEHLTDLGLERNLEDHEAVWSVLMTWALGSNNKLLLRKDNTKYNFFTHTLNYFPPHLLDSELSDRAVTEQAQKAKRILHQKLFSTCARVPEIEGYLHFKDFSKKSWSKKFFFLRGSGLYCSTKGKSKASRDLECHVQFDGANLYSIVNPKKIHKAPTEFGFCIVPFRAKELKELKCLCADDEKAVSSWRMAVRIAKYGTQLRQNYDCMIRKFSKLTKYHERSNQNVMNEIEERTMETLLKKGQVAMDFTGDKGKVITDSREIQELAFTRRKLKITRRISSPNFIPTHTVTPGCQFKDEPWYHGQITRERSFELLMAAGLVDGLFLVRESSSVPGVFVLSFCMNLKVYHCQLVEDIGQGNETFFSLGTGQAFRTLQELICFYQKKPLNGVSLALRIPCPKEDRPLTSPKS